MIKKITIVLLLLALGITHNGQEAAAAPDIDGSRMIKSIFTETGTSFSGTLSSKQKSFQLLNYWDVQEVNLNLDYVVTPLSQEWITSVTLLINDKPFHSFRPSLTETKKQHLSITVPKEWLKKGDNKIDIQGYISTVAEQACSRDKVPDQWLQLYNTSSVDVKFTTQPLKGTIADFHQRFAGADAVNSGSSIITVPDQSDPAELEAAVYVLSGFAKAITADDIELPLLPYKPDYLKNKKLVVLVGLYDRLPADVKAKLGYSETSTKAWIQLLNVGEQPTLVVTSQNPELLAKAGRLVANPDLMVQLGSDTKVLDANTNVDTPKPSFETSVQFTENGDELKGPYYQEQTYYIAMPSNRSIANSGRITLDYRYAQNLDFNRSLVTVSVNEMPVGSKRLTKEMSNGDSVTFPIPSDLNVSGNYSVKVAFDLQLIDAVCTPNQEQTPWAFITNKSMIDFRTKDRTDLFFNHYPYPFLRDGVYNHVAVVLPQERDDLTYRTFSNLFNLLGRHVNGNTGDVKIYSDTAGAEELKDRNIVAVGTYKDNKLIRDHNKSLFFQYDETGQSMLSNEKMSIETEYGNHIGTLQLMESPFASGNGLLAVTGASSENYYLASKLLANEQAKWRIHGDGVVTDKDGNINAFRFKKQTGERTDTVLTDVMKRSDVLGFMTVAGLTALLILVSLILFIRKYRKKRGGTGEGKS
ncbi:cellulose biosynthesis cyclic di-GMP-binding regulatory protein BcsB [Paenibacillus eucommiae]|uniref:Cellulose synthase n=1 Tax=Paenibacillus eucommiae TaxID=1355755 RepID=A0ABS4IZ61_9BACL|nr:cellulose biosynthesis cyclic di-GMP-binding regulatory protein BcsB [Paenibacillus eucommiae]MBP1991829.1 hypothetical protein [Paenibacillus eucommiae]